MDGEGIVAYVRDESTAARASERLRGACILWSGIVDAIVLSDLACLDVSAREQWV